MNGHIFYCRTSISRHFIRAFVIFGLLTVFTTSAFAWGWSRSPGQSSSIPTPSENTEVESADDAQNLESSNSEVTNEAAQQDISVTSAQDDQYTENIADQANLGQATPGIIDQGASDDDNDNSGNPAVLTKRLKRKNMLIKKWREEFAREDVFYVVTDQPLNIPDVKFQLERIQAETPEFPKNQLPFKGSDLALLEEWINDSLDRRIPQKQKSESIRSSLSANSKLDAEGVLKKIADLETKREMLAYGNKALQAMGIFID